MVKDPFRKWDRVDTFCTLLVDLGYLSDQQLVALSRGYMGSYLTQTQFTVSIQPITRVNQYH